MSRIPIVLLIFLVGFAGCQTTPTQPLGNIFSTATTIPPPGTNSYTINSAPQPGASVASTTTNPSNSDGVSPFAPNRPYADSFTSSQEKTETVIQPFNVSPQAETKPTAAETAGSVKVAARTGDEITIPVSAFRTDTGLYSGDSSTSQSPAAGTATETIRVVPFQSE